MVDIPKKHHDALKAAGLDPAAASRLTFPQIIALIQALLAALSGALPKT